MKTTIKIILISIVCLELGLQLAAVIVQRRMAMSQRSSAPHAGKIKVLCLGESTTAWGGDESYPAQLERKLNSSGQPDRFQVFNKGMTSSNSTQILKNLPDFMNEVSPDIAVIMMGINDYWSLPDEPPSRIAVTIQYLAKYLKIFKVVQIVMINLNHQDDLKPRDISMNCPDADDTNAGITNGFPDDLPEMARAEYLVAIEQLRHRESLQAGTDRILKLVNRYHSVTIARAGTRIVEFTYGLLEDLTAFQAAKSLCQLGLKFNPHDLGCRIYLGRSLAALGEEPAAIQILEGLYAEKVADFNVFLKLAQLYQKAHKYNESEAVLSNGLRAMNKSGYCDASYYLQDSLVGLQQFDLHRPDLALQTITEFIHAGANPGRTSQLVNAKLKLRAQLGLPADERPRADMANFWDNSSFRKNLHEMVTQLKNLHKTVVVMQYPRRPVAPLKEILADIPDVIFVENAENFAAYLKNHKFEEAFSDNFGGDFGHFTVDGADLVSRSAAQAILKAEKPK